MAYAEKRGKTWRVKWPLPERGPDGRPKEGSASGFRTKRAALDYGEAQEAEIRAGTWVDPERGKISLDDYWTEWANVQRLAPSTQSRYHSYYRNHLAPAWGTWPIAAITTLDVDRLKKQLLDEKRLKASTVGPIIELLARVLGDAAFDKRISHCPVRPRDRRGERGATKKGTEAGMAITLEQLLGICARLPQPIALMALVTAFTGMRWGEIAGMRRALLFLQPPQDGLPAEGWYGIDAETGALKEVDGHISFGGPKTSQSVRTIELPPFLVELLLAYLETLAPKQDMLFPTSTGEGYRRSNFARQLWRPACDGWTEQPASQNHRGLEAAAPIVEGLRFHDLRHTHETWLAEDHIEKVARDERLGHQTEGMEGVYAHVTNAMKQEILDSLEQRWATAAALSHPWA